MKEIHMIENYSCTEIKALIEARENLVKHTSILAVVKEQAFYEYSTLEIQYKETQKLYTEAKNQNDARMDELSRLKAKDAEQMRKLINTKEINVYATLVKDVTTCL
jgi:hypothetical protein